MSDDLTFSASRWTAFVRDERYAVEEVIYPFKDSRRVRFYSWNVGACGKHTLVGDFVTREDAIEACREHHAARVGGVSMAPAGPVSVDGDGAPV
jgi:hypothetical protein